MTRAALALFLAVALSGCTALRLYRAAGPTDCRDWRGVHIACSEVWP